MKTILKTSILLIALTTISCEKDTCTTCSVVTDAPGASEYYNYCGTDSEINAENTKLKNGCVDLKADYPQYTFDCGCD